jgi:arginyl-tRNA synthetase
MFTKKFEKDLKELIENCIKKLIQEGATSDIFDSKQSLEVELEAPKDKSHGDIATNVALQISKRVRRPPMEYALLLTEKINSEVPHSVLSDGIARVEAKHPGFINFWFSEKKLFATLEYIIEKKTRYGRLDIGKTSKINIEFVSANPTGPLTIAHGRQAAFGDSLANILEFANFRVTREYYLNDEGNQIDLLARSIRARYLELFDVPFRFPEDGYKGSYVIAIAEDIKAKYGARFVKKESLDFFADFGCKWIVEDIKKDLERFNVRFDIWYSQKKLSKSGKIRNALKVLKRKKLLYKKGGATWFRSAEFGDDKDRVVIKSTGEYTYLGPDIAYHMYKFKRGFERLIDIWGPDHHGYIPRIKASVKAFGYSEESLQVLIVQLSTLYKKGKAIQMSTRAGEFITLRDLLDEVGKDVARFFFLRRKRDSHLDFDLELAKKHSMDNPVYYIQYGHARICSILKYYKEKKGGFIRGSLDKRPLKEPEALTIIKLLGRFPLVIELCAKKLEVFPLISYLEEVASSFHSYYDKYRVVTEDVCLTEARLLLCLAIRIVLSNGLRLLGVTSPKSM